VPWGSDHDPALDEAGGGKPSPAPALEADPSTPWVTDPDLADHADEADEEVPVLKSRVKDDIHRVMAEILSNASKFGRGLIDDLDIQNAQNPGTAFLK